jgi:hypothetical protein
MSLFVFASKQGDWQTLCSLSFFFYVASHASHVSHVRLVRYVLDVWIKGAGRHRYIFL